MKPAQRYGSWALITGASDGIGRAFARHAAGNGYHVVLVARRGDRLEALAHELTARHGIRATVVAVDLADPAGLDAVDTATADLDIGLVVLAAGFGTTGTTLQIALPDEMEMVAVNVVAVLRLAHVFARRFALRGSGGLIMFGSIVGWQGVPGQANYAASKAYVQSLAEAMHDELKPLGVHVLSVAPGPVDSGFGARAGLTMTSATSPDVVARKALRALGRRRTVVPGARGGVLTAALAPLPRRARSRIVAAVVATMRDADPA